MKEEAYEEGEIKGRREDILDLLEEINPVLEYLRKEIMEQEGCSISCPHPVRRVGEEVSFLLDCDFGVAESLKS